jgi:hypothetical protein
MNVVWWEDRAEHPTADYVKPGTCAACGGDCGQCGGTGGSVTERRSDGSCCFVWPAEQRLPTALYLIAPDGTLRRIKTYGDLADYNRECHRAAKGFAWLGWLGIVSLAIAILAFLVLWGTAVFKILSFSITGPGS